MFLDIAIAAIGIGVVVMVGYLIIYNVRTALPTPYITNPCYDLPLNESCTGYTDNTSLTIPDPDFADTANGLDTAQTTVFAGFALVAVGIIVLAAFGLISVFK
jgi:hypothetical protein